MTAVDLLRISMSQRPSMFAFQEAVYAVRRREAVKAEAKALAAPKDAPQHTATSRRIMAMMRGAVATAKGLGEHRHANGIDGCPVCSPHDHSDTRIFGYSKRTIRGQAANRDGVVQTVDQTVPVEAWRFICPRCGNADAQLMCNSWTHDGIAHMKSLGTMIPATDF
jgi:hypothetical protein